MYRINEWDGGETVATFQLDPYRFTIKKSNRDGLRRILKDMEDLRQMNGEPSGDDEDGGTSLEGYDEPTADFRLNEIAAAVAPGHTVVEADGE